MGEIIENLEAISKILEQETVSKESYDYEYFLRKEFEIKIYELEHDKNEVLDKINKMESEIADSLEFWDYSPNRAV